MRARSTFALLFWVNTSRVKNNQVTVYLRITVNGKRVNINLKRKVLLSDWDSNKGKQHLNTGPSVKKTSSECF